MHLQYSCVPPETERFWCSLNNAEIFREKMQMKMPFLYSPSLKLISQLISNTQLFQTICWPCLGYYERKSRHSKSRIPKHHYRAIYIMCNWEVENTVNKNSRTSYSIKIKDTEFLSQSDRNYVQLKIGTPNHRYKKNAIDIVYNWVVETAIKKSKQNHRMIVRSLNSKIYWFGNLLDKSAKFWVKDL